MNKFYLVFFIILCACANSKESQLYTYKTVISSGYYQGALHHSRGKTTYDLNKKSIESGHTITSMLDCGDNLKWKCTSYGEFLFAWNQNYKKMPQKWEYMGTEFEVLGNSELEILDLKKSVKLILVRDQESKYLNSYVILMYSEQYGLLGFLNSHEDEDGSYQNIYLLTGRKDGIDLGIN